MIWVFGKLLKMFEPECLHLKSLSFICVYMCGCVCYCACGNWDKFELLYFSSLFWGSISCYAAVLCTPNELAPELQGYHPASTSKLAIGTPRLQMHASTLGRFLLLEVHSKCLYALTHLPRPKPPFPSSYCLSPMFLQWFGELIIYEN